MEPCNVVEKTSGAVPVPLSFDIARLLEVADSTRSRMILSIQLDKRQVVWRLMGVEFQNYIRNVAGSHFHSGLVETEWQRGFYGVRRIWKKKKFNATFVNWCLSKGSHRAVVQWWYTRSHNRTNVLCNWHGHAWEHESNSRATMSLYVYEPYLMEEREGTRCKRIE